MHNSMIVQKFNAREDLMEHTCHPLFIDDAPSSVCLLHCSCEVTAEVGLLNQVDVVPVLEDVKDLRYLWMPQRHEQLELLGDRLLGFLLIVLPVRLHDNFLLRLLLVRQIHNSLTPATQLLHNVEVVSHGHVFDAQLNGLLSGWAQFVAVLPQNVDHQLHCLLFIQEAVTRHLESPEHLRKGCKAFLWHTKSVAKLLSQVLHVLHAHRLFAIALHRSLLPEHLSDHSFEFLRTEKQLFHPVGGDPHKTLHTWRIRSGHLAHI
mmetsp:Transcript_87055/g.153983  ORF Transcript_87055/g.153983 Transcript_87055/m.153983 type:complete len:262 (-) Transcript_87055:386-1171(-)